MRKKKPDRNIFFLTTVFFLIESKRYIKAANILIADKNSAFKTFTVNNNGLEQINTNKKIKIRFLSFEKFFKCL